MRMNRKLKAEILIFIVPLTLVLLFPFTKNIENKTLDMRFFFRGSGEIDRRIVIVSIDEESFRQMDLRWPWPRTVFADLINHISTDGPLAIAFDIELSERGFTPENDAALADAMGYGDTVVIPEKLWVETKDNLPVVRIDRAEDLFMRASAAQGYVNLPLDRDGFVRRVIPGERIGDTRHLPFAIQTAITAVPDIELPHSSPMLINYAGGPGTFFTISFSKVPAGEIGAGFFKDKIVIVGAGFRESGDFLLTPFYSDGGMAGAEVHANIANTVLTGEYLTDTAQLLDFFVFLAVLSAFSILSVRLKPGTFGGIAGGFAALWFAASVLVFNRWNIVLPMADILLMVILVTAGALVYNYTLERHRRTEIHGVFSRFVSPAVVKQLVDTPDLVKLGGEIRTVTLLFSDIRGFTTLSEMMGPEEVVRMLNGYFTAMTEVLFANQGTLNKFIGDAIFAFFGAPTAPAGGENTDEQAVRTALQMRQALAEHNLQRETQGRRPIRIGIGLHRGEVLVGNIGSSRQMEYTVIGDAVNACSRIESYTKEAKTDILISDSVYQRVKEKVTIETMPPVLLKGKLKEITVHKLIEGRL